MADPFGVVSLTAGAAALAWKLYRKCRDSPGQYKDLAEDTKSLTDILREVESLMRDDEHVDLKRGDFIGSVKSCNKLLIELDEHLERYKKLSSHQRKALELDRFRWDKEEVDRLHSRIGHNIQVLSISIQRYNASSQVTIVRLLHDIIGQLARRELEASSVSSFIATDAVDEGEAWPALVKELDEMGLEQEAANENRDLIISILREARTEGFCDPAESRTNEAHPMQPISDQGDIDTTIASSSARVFTSHGGSSIGPRESITSNDASSFGLPEVESLSIASNRKYLEVFDPEASEIEIQVKKQSGTLRDDINLARTYWTAQDWGNCRVRLLRLLAASQLPRHRRADLSPRLLTFLLGVTYSYSGNLEMARVAFTCLITEAPTSAERCASPSSSAPNTPGRCGGDQPLDDDAGIAAATWLGDICLKTDRGPDAVFSYALALDALQRRGSPGANPGKKSTYLSTHPESPAVSPLNRTTLEANNTRREGPKPVHQQFLACELEIADRQNSHSHDLLDYLYADDFPYLGSAFEDAKLPVAPLSVVQEALPSSGSLSHAAYPLLKEYKDKAVPSSTSIDHKSDAVCSRSRLLGSLPERSKIGDESLVPVEERLTIRPSRASWPLMWNPNFSLQAPLYAIDWYHNKTPTPERYLLSDVDALMPYPEKAAAPDFLVRKSNLDEIRATIRAWADHAHIQLKEFPSEVRCRPEPDRSNPWPEVAVFAINVAIVRGEGLFKKTKIAICMTDVQHWNGSAVRRAADSVHARKLLQSFKTYVKAGEAETKAQAKARDVAKYQRRYSQRMMAAAV